MQTTSTLWQQLFSDPNHRRDYRVEIAGTAYGEDAIVSLKTQGALFASSPAIGCCVAGELDLTLYPTGEIPRMARIAVSLRLVSGAQQSEWLPQGVYYIDTRQPDGDALALHGYDAMLKAEQVFVSESDTGEWPRTQQAVVSAICTRMGVELDARTVIDPAYLVEYPNDYTMREILGYIAAAHGGCWIITPAGKLRLLPLTGSGGSALALGQAVMDCSVPPAFAPYSRVTLWYDDEHAYTAGDDTGRTLEADCPWATQAMASALLTAVSGYAYQPFSATGAILDPAAELGDPVSLSGVTSILSAINTTADALDCADISAPGEAEVDHEYPYLSPWDRALRRKVALDTLYFGTRITRAKGLEIVKTDGETEKRRVILNADTLAFYDDDGGEALYFDAAEGRYKFRGVININDCFLVDKDGNLTLGGNVVFTGDSSITQVLYSTDKTTWVAKWDTAWENTETEVWAKYSYNAGATWTAPILIQAKNGERGPAGSSASVTFANIKAALMRASGTETTFITADEFGAPNIYGGRIFGAEIYAGSGDEGEGYAMMTAGGFDVINAAGLHKIGLGLDTVGATDYPYLVLGAGSSDRSTGSGIVKKFGNGIWIGDDSALGVSSFSAITGTGIFISFNGGKIYQLLNGTSSEIGGGGDVTVKAVWG